METIGRLGDATAVYDLLRKTFVHLRDGKTVACKNEIEYFLTNIVCKRNKDAQNLYINIKVVAR